MYATRKIYIMYIKKNLNSVNFQHERRHKQDMITDVNYRMSDRYSIIHMEENIEVIIFVGCKVRHRMRT